MSQFRLLKDEDSQNLPVPSQAFNLTKVMVVLAPVLTAVTAAIAAALDRVIPGDESDPALKFNSTEVTTLIVAMLGALAIVMAADMLARGIASSAKHISNSSIATATPKHAGVVHFNQPIPARLEVPKTQSLESTNPDDQTAYEHPDVYIIAAMDGITPKYLCLLDGTLSWQPANKVLWNN